MGKLQDVCKAQGTVAGVWGSRKAPIGHTGLLLEGQLQGGHRRQGVCCMHAWSMQLFPGQGRAYLAAAQARHNGWWQSAW